MNKTCLILILTAFLFLSGCVSQDHKVETTIASGEAETIDPPSREAVFVYGNTQKLAGRITLNLGGEPVLLPSGYIRLVGVVRGGRPTACLEIGGRGLALEKGEAADDYRIVRIDDDRVLLERGK